MKKKLNLLPLNIQLFADPNPQQELDDLIKEVSSEEVKTDPVKTEPTKTDPVKEETKVEETKVEETEEEDDEEQELGEDGKPKKSSIKELRETYKAEKKRAKELQEAKEKLENDTKTVKERLLKAIKLGIKGETEEEILENLKNHEVKEEAQKTGLTEEQVRKEEELRIALAKLSQEKQEVVFNQRAYRLQKELNLDDKTLLKFIETSAKVGIDLLSTPTDFKEIYNTVMAPKETTDMTEKDQVIKELKAEIARLRGDKAPEESVPGSTKQFSAEDWEKQIEQMEGKK